MSTVKLQRTMASKMQLVKDICMSCCMSLVDYVFLARDSRYAIARYMLSPVHPSVCLSVCHTGRSVKDG